jgi:protein dithiol oxidoreductase (disulfide-forming)
MSTTALGLSTSRRLPTSQSARASARVRSMLVASTMLLLAAVAWLLAAPSVHAQSSREVTLIDPPQPVPNDGTIEVLEFFSYGCVHCANLEPPMDAWIKKLPADVKVRRVPSGFNLANIEEISLYHTLEAMGQIERLHKKIFDAVHNERVMLGHKPTLLKWLEKNGVDPKQYETVEKSFSVVNRVNRGRQLASQYKVTSTPTIVVAGRAGVIQVGGAANMLASVDALIAQARPQLAAQRNATASGAQAASAPRSSAAASAPAQTKAAPAPSKAAAEAAKK